MIFTLKEVIALGSVCSSFGALGAWTYFNQKNITALWNQKQDTNVCVTAHAHIEDDIKEIKGDVKTLLKRNGG